MKTLPQNPMEPENLFPSRRRAVLQALAALALPAGLTVRAAQWPERSITFVQPYAPGTATDASSRYIAQQISERWKVPHRNGAQGRRQQHHRHRVRGPRGARRLYLPDHLHRLLHQRGHGVRCPTTPLDSFVPVAKVGGVQLLLCVPASSRFRSVKELVDFARANPGRLTYASGGNGSSQHLSGA